MRELRIVTEEKDDTLEVRAEELVKFGPFDDVRAEDDRLMLFRSMEISTESKALYLSHHFRWDIVTHKGDTLLIAREKESTP